MTSFALALALTLAAPPAPQLQPASARASSFAPNYKGYTFGPANLIDGSVATSWQPGKSSKDTLGVGQWFEIDLGATYDVSAWELEVGLQKVDPELGDLFCRNTRPASFYLLFDDGSYAWHTGVDPNARRITSREVGLVLGDKNVASARTRYVRFVIAQVHEAVDWKDPAIAELRLFGVPAPPLAAGASATCPSAGFAPFVKAIVEHCAALRREPRTQAGCDLVLDSFVKCKAQVSTGDLQSEQRALPPIDQAALAAGKVSYRFTAFPKATTTVELVKAADQWRVGRITRDGAPWHEQLVQQDGNFANACWEALNKTRPYERDLP